MLYDEDDNNDDDEEEEEVLRFGLVTEDKFSWKSILFMSSPINMYKYTHPYLTKSFS